MRGHGRLDRTSAAAVQPGAIRVDPDAPVAAHRMRGVAAGQVVLDEADSMSQETSRTLSQLTARSRAKIVRVEHRPAAKPRLLDQLANARPGARDRNVCMRSSARSKRR